LEDRGRAVNLRYRHEMMRPEIRLRFLAALLAALVAGCWPSTAENSLPVRDEEYWTIPPEGTKIPAPRAILAGPRDETFVLDNAGRVLVYRPDGTLARKWWMPEYSVGKPEGVCVLHDGRIAVADTHYHRVAFFDSEGEFLGSFGKLGREPGEFIYPVKVIQDPTGDLYVCEYGENDRVQKFRPDGTFILQFGSFGAAPGQFQRPSGIAWYDHRLYIVDAFNNRIQVFQDDGEFLGVLASEAEAEVYYPYDIAATPQGEFYVAEYGAGRVSKFDKTGRLLGRYGSPGTGRGQFATPWGITVDAGGRVLVADTGNRRVVVLRF
jgi:DNA-binding beta-propeller fold protein YncE